MIIALDLETTGIDSKNDKIIEVALLKFDENTFEIIEEYSTLINPGIPIPQLISNITNIFDKDVEVSPYFSDKIKEISDFIGDNPILGHNTNFDRDFLIASGIDLQNNIVLDTFPLSNFLLYKEKSLSLESLAISLKLDLVDAHRAASDTLATYKLFKKLVEIINRIPINQKEILAYIFLKSQDPSIKFLSNYFGFVTNLDELKFEKLILNTIKPLTLNEIKENSDINCEDFVKYFEFEGFEKRENQLKMGKIVNDSFLKKQNSIIEAPTGVGKTFAYLIPGVINSLKNKTQVFISTNTKTLQDQIYNKDLAYLSNNLGLDFTYSKIKGRKNYLGVNPFFYFLNEKIDFEVEEISFVLKIIFWLFETEFGELDELNYFPKEYYYLNEINADNVFILSTQNDYLKYEFLYKVRQNAINSNIVIVNHSLLLQDISTDNTILPNIKNVIIDESHNLEDATTQAVRIDLQKNFFHEILTGIKKILVKHKTTIENFDLSVDKILFENDTLFDLLYYYKNNKQAQNPNFLFTQDFFDKNDSISVILASLSELVSYITNSLELLEDKVYNNLKKDIDVLNKAILTLNIVLKIESSSKYICVYEYDERNKGNIYYTLLNVGEYLQKNIWDKLDVCILASATLKVDNNFDYITNILGLKDFNFYELESDFDYSKQALLYIPDDLGSIKYNFNILKEFLFEFFKVVKGKTLCLFTAFTNIRDLYLSLNQDLKKQNINLYAQSIGGGKYKLLDFYLQNSSNSILLGTDSFWEGVDIPGDNLKYLVIHKFPFLVPNDPIFLARGKLFKDSFAEYSLPKTVLKTKQGFGRLIRTKQDSGLVLLLDDRIYSTSYGKRLYGAFPSNLNIKVGNSQKLLEILNKKLDL